jgi:hypothetical protein
MGWACGKQDVEDNYIENFCEEIWRKQTTVKNVTPTERIYVKLDIRDFHENTWENPNLVKIKQKYRALYRET